MEDQQPGILRSLAFTRDDIRKIVEGEVFDNFIPREEVVEAIMGSNLCFLRDEIILRLCEIAWEIALNLDSEDQSLEGP